MADNEIGNRPWGQYVVLLDSPITKVKAIQVEPQQRLSYQSHEFRREVWTCVSGELTVILDGGDHTLQPGDVIKIPQGSKHRAWNKTDEAVNFIEVQLGDSFEEDDIIRYEDDYERE